jgi:hypothetical protein
MLDQQFNKDVIGYANYWLNQSAPSGLDQQKIGLLLLNHTNTNVGAIPANFFFSL